MRLLNLLSFGLMGFAAAFPMASPNLDPEEVALAKRQDQRTSQAPDPKSLVPFTVTDFKFSGTANLFDVAFRVQNINTNIVILCTAKSSVRTGGVWFNCDRTMTKFRVYADINDFNGQNGRITLELFWKHIPFALTQATDAIFISYGYGIFEVQCVTGIQDVTPPPLNNQPGTQPVTQPVTQPENNQLNTATNPPPPTTNTNQVADQKTQQPGGTTPVDTTKKTTTDTTNNNGGGGTGGGTGNGQGRRLKSKRQTTTTNTTPVDNTKKPAVAPATVGEQKTQQQNTQPLDTTKKPETKPVDTTKKTESTTDNVPTTPNNNQQLTSTDQTQNNNQLNQLPPPPTTEAVNVPPDSGLNPQAYFVEVTCNGLGAIAVVVQDVIEGDTQQVPF
ncbi:uncharacterized protein J3D65DRAFT_682143 [Phyllosticta citribraziliensis]|uniref:Uncharacterized protein n=1 Tax=Phyllosticta citribraziliensis TaxID=989973 RepID=A0ABR1M8G1_9PEZI